MFSYYGSKSKIVDYYPPPKYDTIIEPFAGSARYSLKYWYKDIVLVDKYSVIIDTWQWLSDCSKEDILGLPNMKLGESVDEYDITDDEKRFLGFLVQQGTTGLRKTVSKFGKDSFKREIKRVAEDLYKIREWKIINDDYRNLDNIEATWFIDPPYQNGGHEYKHSNKELDFDELANWCKSRNGQVIVCENTKADWLPFKPMTKMQGSMYKTTEAIWSNLPTNYDNTQQTLF